MAAPSYYASTYVLHRRGGYHPPAVSRIRKEERREKREERREKREEKKLV